jgi:EAL domain-containing protein (putative c-di-GMP-specific phosphodiesterase class I)
MAQRDFLARHGCHCFQGYLFSKPLPIEELELFIQTLPLAPGSQTA